MKFITDLASRRRFGMKPGLETIGELCRRLENPEAKIRAIHIAGTNGKGATAAIVDAALLAEGYKVGRYTSPHLLKLNERFFLNGIPIVDEVLECSASLVSEKAKDIEELTFFEALTAVAFELYAREKVDYLVLETGLGGRLDATNIARSSLTIITKIGLDHCDWLGHSLEAIAGEKAGIIKRGIPIVLGKNSSEVIEVVKRRAEEMDAPFYYAPEIIAEKDIPRDYALSGAFNRENAITALAALKVMGISPRSLAEVVWPGRFQRIGRFIVDGAHNPPAAKALFESLEGEVELIAGFCADKDVEEVLRILKPKIKRAYAVKTVNERSLGAEELSEKMRELGIEAKAKESLSAALEASRGETLVCGSLFLAGEALKELRAYPWGKVRIDENEKLSSL